MRKLLPILFLPFLFSGCDNEPKDLNKNTAEPTISFEAPRTEIYFCEDGRQIEVTYAGDTAVVDTGTKQYLMVQAIAASGARYVSDDGAEWHVKGKEGIFGVSDEAQLCNTAGDLAT